MLVLQLGDTLHYLACCTTLKAVTPFVLYKIVMQKLLVTPQPLETTFSLAVKTVAETEAYKVFSACDQQLSLVTLST